MRCRDGVPGHLIPLGGNLIPLGGHLIPLGGHLIPLGETAAVPLAGVAKQSRELAGWCVCVLHSPGPPARTQGFSPGIQQSLRAGRSLEGRGLGAGMQF